MMSTARQRRFHFLPLLLLLLTLVGCGGGDNDSTRPLNPGDTPPPAPLSLSGTVTAVAGNAVDSDVNDPAAPYLANDTPATAQTLANPVVLGGYLTAVATGVAGDRCAAVADIQDWYRMTLVAGQTITLTIANHDGNAANSSNPDFDLYLTDQAGDPLLISSSLSRQETILVAASGDYLVQVYAFNLGSNYTLGVGAAQAGLGAAPLNIADDFVPGEVIVRFREPSSALAVAPPAASERPALAGLVHKAGRGGEAMLYRLHPSSATMQALSRPAAGGLALRQAKRATIDQVEALRRRADVVSADLNYLRRATLTPDDPLFPQQWNATMINLPAAWDLTLGSPDVVVAVIDSGVLLNHPDLAGRLCTVGDPCAGYDFVADPTSAADGDGIDADPDDPGDQSHADGSSSFHGTHVAGLVGAAGDNATGVAGVDWGAPIMPVRVLGVGGGTSYDVMQGVRYAAGLSNDSATMPGQRADILNLSLGGNGYSQAEQDLFTAVRNLGIIVVAAAGNNASNVHFYPAAYAGVVAVSAVDEDKALAGYSSYGAAIDLAAPGGKAVSGILSTSGNDLANPIAYTYASLAGTSMAAPQVAGVVALMRAEYPTLTPTEFDVLLTAGSLTEDLGGDGAAVRNDSFGYGLIDAQKAVLAAHGLANGGVLPPSLAVTPALLDFGATTTTLPLTLSNAGGGTLAVTGFSDNAAWLTVDGSGTDASGLGAYTVTVDRAGLADAVYAATITFTTDIPSSYDVAVYVQVGSGGVANAGLQTIYLLDAASGTRLQSQRVAADPANGTYPYAFADVIAGNYLVMAGSDLDRDGQLCDAGEACGGYPLLTDPAVIAVTTGSLGGIDFSSGFDANR